MDKQKNTGDKDGNRIEVFGRGPVGKRQNTTG